MIRVLDPATAVVRPGQELGTTAYVSDRLLVRNNQLWDRDQRVDQVLAELGWGLRVPERYRDKGIPRRAPRNPGIDLESSQVAGLELRIITDAPTAAPDAWTALQQIRTAAPDVADSYELVHVMVAADTWSGVGKGGSYIPGIGKGGSYVPGIGKGGSYVPGIGLGPDEFGVPGYGGKAPVALVVADPSKTAPRLKRPPVVVMPDTGIGAHPWFPDEATVGVGPAQPASLGVRVFGSPVADREPAIAARLTGELARLAGHGTFIAGIVRQACPAARLTSYAVMSSAGLVAEDDALDVLQQVLDQQLAALAAGDPSAIVDVLTLSFGYYHEDLPDEDSDPSTLPSTSIGTLLRDLGRAGVLVVAGAGNDGTSRPFLPAAFAGDTGTGSGDLPLVSVGSLNPNHATVSLFSNGGTWVTAYRHGAAIVSTLPRLQNASSQSSSDVAGLDTLTGAAKHAVEDGTAPAPADRSTIDMDDFSGGFGVWSGTSFSAPLLAGQLAQALVGQGTDAVDLDTLRSRGWAALARVLRPLRRL
ncbi:S8 family serine peptidase [Propionicimonas sp.]|uniref:S8 family serine peptidase n=1 Tax=Propionicimonas sp. TaxID=1955623 RepID=UPI0039E48D92